MTMSIRNLLPYSLDIANLSLYAQLALSSYFSGNFLNLHGEHSQLVNHVVYGINQAQHLSGHGNTNNFLAQVSTSDSSL
jgi:L-2-hydroxyglutarate oxidase LhgO